MKKIFCVLLIAVSAAGLGFTQELKFSGYMNYGLGFGSSSQAGNDIPQLRTEGVDSEQAGGRFRLNASYANADKNTGADLRLQLQGVGPSTDRVSTNAIGLAYAYGWVKPIDMLQVKAGIVSDSTFETAGAILRDDAGGGAGLGLFVKLTPIEGLDVGVGAYSRGITGSNENNVIYNISDSVDWYSAKYTFGLAYTMPEMFKINTSFRWFNKVSTNSSSRGRARAIGEVRLLAVENLTAIVEVELDDLWNEADEFERFSKAGKFNIFETLAYKIDALQFGLNAAQYFNNAPNSDIGLRFNPWVSYALSEGKIVPRLDGVFFLAGDRSTGSDANKWDRRMDVAATYKSDNYVWNVRPSVKFNIDSRTFLEIGDVFYYRKPAVGDGFMDNVFYVDMVVRF